MTKIMSSFSDLYTIIISIIALVFLFLFFVEKFSYQIETVFKDKIKEGLHKWTKIPIIGAILGFVITSIVQSSTAVSVLLVSMVHSRVLYLAGALSVIIGTNVGTTLTIQLISFKILDLAPYFIILGFFLMKIKSRFQVYGKSIFYFGIVFSSLYLISVITHPLADSSFMTGFASLASNLWLGILIGFLIVNILQSSTITTGIVVVLASQGVLDFSQSLFIILGANIGTTLTAILASLATGKEGKRVALGHFIFNFIGTVIFIPFIPIFSKFILSIPIPLFSQVALSHFLFNFIIAGIFLIFFKYYHKLVLYLIKN